VDFGVNGHAAAHFVAVGEGKLGSFPAIGPNRREEAGPTKATKDSNDIHDI
jgi:hypothetical protein